MRENITQMQARHQKEMYDLQAKCKHNKISKWMDYMWAIGHFGYPVKVCEFCGKIVKQKKPTMEAYEIKDGKEILIKIK